MNKLVTISIFFAFLKHEKDAILLFLKICLENFLGSARIHENNIFFKGEINLKVLLFFLNFLNFFRKYFEENQVFWYWICILECKKI